VYEQSPDVCGTYVVFNNTSTGAGNDGAASIQDFEVTIPVKINLHQILMLSSVRYLPSFCGRWEIELYPSAQNLVVMQVPFEWTMSDPDLREFEKVTGGFRTYRSFTQIGKDFQWVDGLKKATAVNKVTQKLTCTEGTLDQCLMSTTTFLLRYEVFEGLRQMYAEQPLIIPTNILTYARFSGQPGANQNGAIFHATLSQSLENCDSVFILCPNQNDQTTCFYQPFLKEVRLALGEFGTHPDRSVQTWDDPRFVAMVLDSLNLETSEITSMNRDVRSSLQWYNVQHAVTGADAARAIGPWERFSDMDMSNFFIGISLSQVGFQSGTVSSPNTNVPFIFDAVLDRTANTMRQPAADKTDNKKYGYPLETSIVMMILIDAALMIQVIPDSDIPVVKLTSKSIV
jgi:hypothetical protein